MEKIDDIYSNLKIALKPLGVVVTKKDFSLSFFEFVFSNMDYEFKVSIVFNPNYLINDYIDIFLKHLKEYLQMEYQLYKE